MIHEMRLTTVTDKWRIVVDVVDSLQGRRNSLPGSS